MGSYIIEEIIQLTGDSKSRAFWEKAVRLLGENIVAEEFGEMKAQMHTKNIREPRKYLTALLKTQLKAYEAKKSKQAPPAIPEKLKTYFEENQIALFSNLVPLPIGGEAEKKAMEVPYSKETIPWATFMSSNFFTLSTNKAKSDVVQAKFRTADGEVTVIPMIRGRAKPKGEELGIPTVEHGRILAALENIWAQQGCPYHTYSDSNAVVCFCLVSIRELAQLLGRTNFGGRDLVQLTNKVWNLKNMAYYLDMASVGFKHAINRGFSLLHSVELAEGMKHGQMETILKVEFSTQLSSQLLSRRAVTRPKQLAHIQSELGFLIRLFLEPILFSLDGEVYSKSLGELIKDLALPAAPWHKYKSKRRQVFQKALKSMHNQKTTDGRGIVLDIEEGLTDYLLTARLEPVALPAKVI
ncbi:MAG TPA: hypothetical protein DER10_01825 [Elusimicrobia bacterium]|nr:hypothetical protein [Elusimicrobiota bacterium]